jgi:hypothetical protein
VLPWRERAGRHRPARRWPAGTCWPLTPGAGELAGRRVAGCSPRAGARPVTWETAGSWRGVTVVVTALPRPLIAVEPSAVTRRARTLLERVLAGVLTRWMLPVRLPVRLSLRRAAGERALLRRRGVLRTSRLRTSLRRSVPRPAGPAGGHAWLWPAGKGAAFLREAGARVPGSGYPGGARSALAAALPLASAALWPGGGAWLWLPAPSP